MRGLDDISTFEVRDGERDAQQPLVGTGGQPQSFKHLLEPLQGRGVPGTQRRRAVRPLGCAHRVVAAEVRQRHPQHLDEVDAIQPRAESGRDRRQPARGIAAAAGTVNPIAAGTGIHGGDELECGRKLRLHAGAGDHDRMIMRSLRSR